MGNRLLRLISTITCSKISFTSRDTQPVGKTPKKAARLLELHFSGLTA